MDLYRQTAMFCVGRAVFFSVLAIAVVMLSFAFAPALACRIGGTAGLMISAILLWFFQTAGRRDPRQTETFLLLPKETRPRDETARRMFAGVMADVYLYYATRAFALSVALIVSGLALPFVL